MYEYLRPNQLIGKIVTPIENDKDIYIILTCTKEMYSICNISKKEIELNYFKDGSKNHMYRDITDVFKEAYNKLNSKECKEVFKYIHVELNKDNELICDNYVRHISDEEWISLPEKVFAIVDIDSKKFKDKNNNINNVINLVKTQSACGIVTLYKSQYKYHYIYKMNSNDDGILIHIEDFTLRCFRCNNDSKVTMYSYGIENILCDFCCSEYFNEYV